MILGTGVALLLIALYTIFQIYRWRHIKRCAEQAKAHYQAMLLEMYPDGRVELTHRGDWRGGIHLTAHVWHKPQLSNDPLPESMFRCPLTINLKEGKIDEIDQ